MKMAWILAVTCAGALVGCEQSPEDAEKSLARDTYDLCMKDFRDELKSASTRDVIRQVCERMRAQYRERYRSEP